MNLYVIMRTKHTAQKHSKLQTLSDNDKQYKKNSKQKAAAKLRRHRLTLQSIGKPKHKNVTNFFSHRVVSLWNSLPEYVVTAPSLPIFKNYLKKFDLCSITTIIY